MLSLKQNQRQRFVKLKVSVQFMVIKETVYDAFINWNIHTIKLLLMYLMSFVPKFLKLDDVLKER
jgi:hypothetical protein